VGLPVIISPVIYIDEKTLCQLAQCNIVSESKIYMELVDHLVLYLMSPLLLRANYGIQV
jgi:hypothetical protein